MPVFGQFELVISIFSVGLLNTKGDMQALSSFSLNHSDHKLTQLINIPMAMTVTLWLVPRILLLGTLTDSDTSDDVRRLAVVLVINRSSRESIGSWALVALASQNTRNAPSEIILTWDFRNDLHDICPKLKLPANCVVSIPHVCFPWDLQNPMCMRYALRQCSRAMHVGSPWQQYDCSDIQIFLRKTRESKIKLFRVNIFITFGCYHEVIMVERGQT